MTTEPLLKSVLHKIPTDIKNLLLSDKELLTRWNSLTPIQRNEWICWVTYVKKEETRVKHIIRLGEDLHKGKRAPCCWPGCPHRNLK